MIRQEYSFHKRSAVSGLSEAQPLSGSPRREGRVEAKSSCILHSPTYQAVGKVRNTRDNSEGHH